MDNSASTNSSSILDTLRTVEFRLGLKGYNVDEVDEYLEKAAVEAEQVQERLRTANERLRQSTERMSQMEAELQRPPSAVPARPPERPAASAADADSSEVADDSLQRTLLLAQKFVEQTKRESEAEAAEIVGRAEERARAVLSQAEERARQMSAEAEQRLRDDVARLEALRTRLTADVKAMSEHFEEQRAKMRASLTEALKWVEEPVPGAPMRTEERRTAPDETRAAGTQSTERRPGGEGGAPGGPAPVAGSAPAAGSPRPSGVPAPERTQAPVVASVGALNGGLFDAGRSGDNGIEGPRRPE